MPTTQKPETSSLKNMMSLADLSDIFVYLGEVEDATANEGTVPVDKQRKLCRNSIRLQAIVQKQITALMAAASKARKRNQKKKTGQSPVQTATVRKPTGG